MKQQLLTLLFLALCTNLNGQSFDAAVRLFENEEFQLAKTSFEQVKSSDPKYGVAQYYLGRIAFDKQEYDDARDHFKRAIKEDENNADYYVWLGNTIGSKAQNVSKLRQGILAPKIKNAYKKAVELDPTLIDAQWGLMEFYTQAPGMMGGSWEKGEEAARAILEVNPIRGRRALATVFERKGDPELAEKEYLALVELDGRYLLTLGYFYQNQAWYDKAFDTFLEGFEKTPDNRSIQYQIGRTSALSGQRAETGIDALEAYLTYEPKKNQPSHAAAKSRLAMIYEKQGNIEKAKSLYQEALKAEPELGLAKEGLKRVK